ncbi:MAG: helix-turn-helix domain-containing protein [Blautia sp.]
MIFEKGQIERSIDVMKSEGEIKVKSLQKAMEILECFVVKQPLGVTEISEKLGLYKSNVHNILMTFKAMGYVEQDPDSGKFRLGVEVFSLSRAYRQNLNMQNRPSVYAGDRRESGRIGLSLDSQRRRDGLCGGQVSV